MYRLIRDNIPEILKEEGKPCDYATAQTDGLFADLLRRELIATVNSFLTSNTVDDLADVLAVIDTILEIGGISKEDFEKLCTEKLEKLGGYTKRLIFFAPDQQAQQTTTEDSTK